MVPRAEHRALSSRHRCPPWARRRARPLWERLRPLWATLSVGEAESATVVGSGTATTASVTTTAGSLIFVLVTNSTTTPSAPSDSLGNTFVAIGPNLASALSVSVMLYISESGAARGSGHTFSASNNDATIAFVEIIGNNPQPFALAPPQAADTSSPFTSQTITPAQGVDVILVSACVSNSTSSPATLAESSGFTIQSEYITGESMGLATRSVNASGSYTASWTSTGATQAFVYIGGVREGGDAVECLSIGTYVNGTANLTPVIIYARAGDMMVCYYGTKPYNDAPTINNSWTSLGSATDGTVAAGTDTGSMQARLFYKLATSSSESNPTVTNTTNNVSGAVILVFRAPPGHTFELPVGAGGGDASAGTGFSCTASSNFGISAKDMLVGFGAIRSDAGTQSSITITATGLTVGTFAEAPSADLATTAGGDMAMSGGYVPATAGAATAAPVYASTLGASHTGSAFMARLRAVPLLSRRKPYLLRRAA